MSKTARTFAIVAAAAAVLAASACTEVMSASSPTWTGSGTLDFAIHDGGATTEGGGPITAVIQGPNALSLVTECGPGGFENTVCSRGYSGTLTTKPGFTGDPGRWSVRMSTLRSCGVGGCEPLYILFDEIRTPDGTDGLSSIIGPSELIDGTDGCPDRGVKLVGTSPLESDPAIDVDVRVVICSPGLAAHMAATRSPG